MYLYGASGHAKVIVDILKANGIAIDGMIDDDFGAWGALHVIPFSLIMDICFSWENESFAFDYQYRR